LPHPLQHGPARHGLLDLMAAVGPDGRTRPVRAAANPPLQLSRVRYDDPAQPDLAVFTLLTLGGVLAGDQNCHMVELGPSARLRVVMAAATQVLAMPGGSAEQRFDLRLGPESRLEWLAEPLILFADASLTQHTTITLAPGAVLVWLDVLTPGRLARGEIHRFRRFQYALEVRSETGVVLAAERADLTPGHYPLDLPGVLGGQPVVGTLFILGDTIEAERLAALVGGWDAPDIGASALPNRAGLLVRALGASASAVRSRLGAVLERLGAGTIV
jgi:urease accessory protein